ncbi:MAG: DNA mismatch repair protein MutS [Candidatus Omnitrophica bacterium]|nr:DNA mismatch repair protein MutS [Candidatus Omnitrophota bacterium]
MRQGLSSEVESKRTPMMEQYRSIKNTLSPDTVLFFRLGDFYEMFFEDALRGSEILNITLTGRDGGAAGRVPMCGIPFHSFQPYVRTLLDRNLKVAICEQVGDPSLAKGLMERKVSRIITPATFLDDEGKERQAEYLVAVAAGAGSAGGDSHAVAAADLGTGEFFVREMTRERLAGEMTLLAPREAILPRRLSGDAALTGLFKEGLRAAVTFCDDAAFEPAEDLNLAFRHDHPLAASAAGALLSYLKDHLHSDLEHLRAPVLLTEERFMTLDRQTLRNLELISHLGTGARSGSLLACIDQTMTPMGGRTLAQWLTRPLVSLAEIHGRQEGVAELAEELERAQRFRSLLKGVRDIERTLSRLHLGVGNARDLLSLRFFLERIPEIQEALARLRSPALKELAQAMRPFPELAGVIARAILEAPPTTLRDGGLIRDGYSRPLDDLRRMTTEGKSWLIQFQRREIERTGIKSLKVRYSQVFGYSMEVSKPNLHLVPAGYIRKQTLVNAERFIVPELREWDERISGTEERIKALEQELFQEIRRQALEALPELQEMARAAGRLDAFLSLAVTAIQRHWARPAVEDSRQLLIEGGRHPVVEAALPAGRFVENDTFLDGADHQLVVLTGPNMAGKSTYIRQVAQIVLLAQIGSYVPAASARIGLVDRIFTRIGASDDLARGESTFMVEMVEMAQILEAAAGRSLLILDEVGRGTSTFDGVSLAWAICEHLVQGPVRPRTLFATHYHELTQLEEEFPGIKNYTITVKETAQGILFLRKVVRGGSDRSYGIHVAELAGIPRSVTDRAARILAVLEKENSQATRIIEGR